MGGKGGVVVGVAPASPSRFHIGGFAGLSGVGTLGYCASGEIVSDSECVGRAEPFSEGDIVGVLVDMNSLAVGFFLNDQAQVWVWTTRSTGGVAGVSTGVGAEAEELKTSHEEKEIVARLSRPQRALVAAVSLAHDTDEVLVFASDMPRGVVR